MKNTHHNSRFLFRVFIALYFWKCLLVILNIFVVLWIFNIYSSEYISITVVLNWNVYYTIIRFQLRSKYLCVSSVCLQARMIKGKIDWNVWWKRMKQHKRIQTYNANKLEFCVDFNKHFPLYREENAAAEIYGKSKDVVL